MTLTKAELVDLLVGRVGLNKREARDMVDAFFEEISAALEKSNGVKLSNFGNFELREKPQRPGRNPKTGELVPISARRVVTFHASAKLKTAVESAPRQYPPPTPAPQLSQKPLCPRLKPPIATTAADIILAEKCARLRPRTERSGAASSQSRRRRRAPNSATPLGRVSPPSTRRRIRRG